MMRRTHRPEVESMMRSRVRDKRRCELSDRHNHRGRHLWSRYRLYPEEFDGMVWLQDNKCAMCGASFDEATIQVDHDRNCCAGRSSCGRCIRGLLCKPCNVNLGGFEAVADSAPDYLALGYMGS